MYLALINPKAGNRGYKKIEKPLQHLYKKLKLKVNSFVVEDLIKLPSLIKKELSKKQYEGVIILGGQTTLSTVVGALEGTLLPLIPVPLSKKGYVANSLGIKQWKDALFAIKENNKTDFALGKIGKHFFINKLVIAPRQSKFPPGLKNNLKTLFGFLKNRTKRSIATTLEIDNRITVKAQTTTISVEPRLTKQLKPCLYISLEAQTEDPSALSPTFLEAQKIKISSSLDMPIMSGEEVLAKTPATIEILPYTIPLILPKNKQNKNSSVKMEVE